MAKLTFRQQAINDLTDIWNYTLYKWSENQADKYYQSIKLACEEIASYPKIGKNYNDISKNLLGYPIGKHIIFYQKISEDEIEIIRVLHENMDLKNRVLD